MTAITVPIQGYFHDAANFSNGELNAPGVLGATVYTDGTHAYPIAEVQAILGAGKCVLLNHENAALQLEGGAATGRQAGSDACAAAVAYGAPQGCGIAIFYSVDGNVPASMFPTVAQAFVQIRAIHGGRWLVGFYGELALYKYLKSIGLVDVKCWLSASASFPGFNPNDPDVGMVQLVGTDVPNTDRDAVIDMANLGVWGMTQPSAADNYNLFNANWEPSLSALAGSTFQQALALGLAPVLAAIENQPAPTLTGPQIQAIASAIVAALPPSSDLTAADVQSACSAALAGTPLLADLTLTIGAKS